MSLSVPDNTEASKMLQSWTEERTPDMRVKSEPLTYQARLIRDPREKTGYRAVSLGEPRSYIQDFWAAQRRGDVGAEERLQRHAREMEVLREEWGQTQSLSGMFDMESRTINWTPGTGGYFAPPLWILNEFATFPRSGRVLAAKVPSFDLPVGAQSVNVPAMTAGEAMGSTYVTGPVADTDETDAPLSSNVATFAGNADVPVQMLEQSPQGAHLDWVVFTDMESGYNYQLERQMIFGTGQGNSLLGIVNNLPTTYVNPPQIVYTAASPLATTMFTYFGQMIAAVGRNRRSHPELWMMNTPRAGWIATSEDNQSRPLLLANTDGAGNFDLATVPASPNDAITNTFGTSGLEDRIILCKPSDWLLFESDRYTDIMGDVLSGVLMVRLQMRRYAAAVCRYPSGNSIMTGSGLVPQSGF